MHYSKSRQMHLQRVKRDTLALKVLKIMKTNLGRVGVHYCSAKMS